MNIALTLPAEELPPHRAFTVADIRRMMDVGVLGENERFELVEGDIFMMSPKGVVHENIKHALTLALARTSSMSASIRPCNLPTIPWSSPISL